MDYEIISNPFQVQLIGYRGSLDGQAVHAVGKPLMDRLWQEVKQRGLATKGINHWVYLPNSEMFVGVELADEQPAADVGDLERLDVSLDRHVRYLHVGPYSQLHVVWPQLMAEITSRGETPFYPSLEIYGHWNPDESKCETTILIALK
jgi:hypothetical protein